MTSSLTHFSIEITTMFCLPLLIQMKMVLTLVSTEVMLMRTTLMKINTKMIPQLKLTILQSWVPMTSNFPQEPPPFQRTGAILHSIKRSIENIFMQTLLMALMKKVIRKTLLRLKVTPKLLEPMTSNLTHFSIETTTTFYLPLLIQMKTVLTLVSTEVMLTRTMLTKIHTKMILQLKPTQPKF